MKTVRRHLLVLACLSALLVNIGSQAASIQDTLPALVLDEPAESKGSEAAPESAPTSASASPELALSATDASARASTEAPEEKAGEPKLISYETKADESSQQAASSTTSSERPLVSSSEAAESSEQPEATQSSKETTSQSSLESTTKSQPEQPSVSGASEKDISVLLANKNDADNDLASPASAAPTESEPKPSASVDKSETMDKKQVELDSPVDTNKPSTNDDRLHYAFSNPDKAPEEPAKASEPAPDSAKPSEPAQESVVEGKKDEAKKEEEEEPKTEVSPTSSESPRERPLPEVVDETKKVEYDEKTKSVVVESVESTSSSEKPTSPKVEEAKPASSEPEVSSSAASSTSAVDGSTTEQATSKPEQTVTGKSEPAQEKEKPQVVVTVAPAEPKPQRAEVNKTIEVSSAKPASVPTSVLAVALGTALGAAVAPKQIPVLKPDSNKPAVAVSTTTTTTTSSTTKAPSGGSTTRKSTTDKWDRRRPILPSIRRRFRPYNRFSPFPWGGADSYSPIGGEPEFVGADVTPPKAPSSTTNKPRRRASSTTELPPKSSTSSSTVAPPTPKSSDEESKLDEDEVPVSSSRRRPGVNKRRHHHHHHHHNHHSQANPGDSSAARRRHNPSHRHHEREPAFGEPSPYEPNGYNHQARPFVPGFSLFNVGSTGSGFDLLNPFSGWLDDKPRPPIRGSGIPAASSPPLSSSNRPLGHRPIGPFDGDYNDDHAHTDHNYPGSSRPHGRDDYHDHHDHHHDCHHDHDYDHHHDHHREPHRPYRPHRDREPVRPPIGGDYDTYPPASFGSGRRPSRPYNRRDQADKENESSEASPSLYGSRISSAQPVAPKRVPSIFSPFDSLFGSLDDEIFSLRSSFIDTPLKSDSTQTFDAVVTSPKISMPSNVEVVGNKESHSSSSPDEKVKEANPSSENNNHNTNGKPKSGESATGSRQIIKVEQQSALASVAPASVVTINPRPVGLRSNNQEPCSYPARGLICFFMHQPIFDLFQRL